MRELLAFILAAGFGERLRPITDHLPKPLLPVLGRPVIERVIKRIAAVPVKRIGINLHYKSEMIRAWAEKSCYFKNIHLFNEASILGTGGALKNAEGFLAGSFFLVHNSDILSDISLGRLIEKHLSGDNCVTLAVHDCPAFNNVWLDEAGRLRSVGGIGAGEDEGRQAAFTGIAVYSPEFLSFLPRGRSSVVDAWLRAASAGLTVGTVDFSGCSWEDIGSPAAYASYTFGALKEVGETVFVHHSVDCSGVRLGGNAVIEEGSVPEKGSSLRNCILLPGSRARSGEHIENAIVGSDYKMSLQESLPMQPTLPSGILDRFPQEYSGVVTVNLVGTGGSDRKYYRLRWPERTTVLMECPGTDPDYERHMSYTHFFRRYSVPVPDLHGPVGLWGGRAYAFFEDLGDTSLYSWLKCNKDAGLIRRIYERVLDILVTLHTEVTRNVSECRLLQTRIFDYSHLRWETDYFVGKFAVGLRGVRVVDAGLLESEFDRLARNVDSFGKTVIHRDFQSQNIMVTDGDLPRVIDYQGARMGPPAYDLASLLWDPYSLLGDGLRAELVDYYISGVKDYHGSAFDEELFRRTVRPCRMQRHMQALGAYGFLSKLKGKAYFRKYVPQALRYLKEEVGEVKDEYPVLSRFVEGMDENTED